MGKTKRIQKSEVATESGTRKSSSQSRIGDHSRSKYRLGRIGRDDVKVPSTRYQGSKEKLANWIWDNISVLNFDTFLDALGGTGSVGYIAKVHGRETFFNDVFGWNYYIGLAIIENSSTVLSGEDVTFLLSEHNNIRYHTFIQDTFKDIYYTDDENAWLDMFIGNLGELRNKYKRALALSALFQACLVKRPYNLFHRANLYMREADVERSFGNKATWDTTFPEHFRSFVREYNEAVYENGRDNRALNFNVFEIPNPEKYDIVYIDPPYFSKEKGPTDYYFFYHFLEGLCIYLEDGPGAWREFIDFKRKPKPLKHCTQLEKETEAWTKREKIIDSFERLFRKFKDSILVVSYNSEGVPSEDEMNSLLGGYKDNVHVERIAYQYALSPSDVDELLFIAT